MSFCKYVRTYVRRNPDVQTDLVTRVSTYVCHYVRAYYQRKGLNETTTQERLLLHRSACTLLRRNWPEVTSVYTVQKLLITLISGCARTFICTYIVTDVQTYVRTYVRTFVRTYVRTYVLTYVCTYVHVRPHVHMCGRSPTCQPVARGRAI